MSTPENPPVSPTNSLVTQTAEKRRSWRDRNPDEGPENEIPDNMTETSSVVSFKSAHSKLLSTAKSMESISSIVDDRSMVTAASGSIEFDNDDDRCITPTEVSDFDLHQLNSENMRLQEQVNKLKEERKRWTLKRPHKADLHQDETLVQILEDRLNEAESLIQDYRDENTSLKCELREINEGIKSRELDGKLKSAEELCDELMVENEQLKNEVRDLQQEVEEMQDQYREEEIEEFRELQRELEQNAKNCRVLQFKLKKAERSREQLKTENEVLAMKLREQSKPTNLVEGNENDSDDNSVISDSTVHSQSVKVRELESELRIAKEVSFRLHKELETAEEKRYKLEDDVFYYKEKLRELQTQSKWRDSRNRTEVSNQRRQSIEVPEDLSNDDLRTLIEREGDLRDQLRFAEEDLKRTRAQMQELENENEELMQKLARFNDVSNTRSSLNKKPIITRSARMLELEIDTVKKLQNLESDSTNGKLNAEVEKDMTRLIGKIQELEKQNNELQLQIRRPITNDHSSSRDKAMSVELRQERQQRKELESELTEYKQLIAKSDNAKLIAMATKVELLTNQLNMALERANAAHKKFAKDSGVEESYADQLKKQIEHLEKQNSELLAKETFKVVTKSDMDSPTMPTADEIEHCCVVLASVEAQTTRICKQLDRLDNSQKEERRRSLSRESAAGISVDLASVMAELKVIRQVLKTHKQAGTDVNKDADNENGSAAESAECAFCSERDQQIEKLKEEIGFYKKKNKELTNQVLQTEDRWTVEIEKQTYNYKTEIRHLESDLDDLRSRLKEQEEVANARMVTLVEKQKTIEEQTARTNRLEHEINERQKIIQDYEKEQKALKEFEIKYRKIEDMYQKEKERYNSDRCKIKSEMSLAKKKSEEASLELEKVKQEMGRKESVWLDEKKYLQNEINQLKKAAKKDGEDNDEEEEEEEIHFSPRPVIRTINYRVTKINNEMGVPELKEKLVSQQQKYSDLEGKFNKLQLAKECLENELNRLKDSAERERNDFQHRTRQNEKIRSFEIDALQQKFTSRMNIMENTNKSLHTQLVQLRRERDRFRDSTNTMENKLLDEQRNLDEERRKNSQLSNINNDLEKKIKAHVAEIDRLSHELKLKIDAHKADCTLWEIQKKHLEKNQGNVDNESKDVRITEDALNAAEAVQKQYAEYQKFYTKEVTRLNKKIKEMAALLNNKEAEFSKKANEVRVVK
uniref:Girdin n=1 Tax=Bursaphelenchus xylophilus TaxID=6326 RepID=A0A1I7SF64_BURXY